ncbi:MAG: outer membrane beta-barrel protein, partial [Pseudomonadota bacterium]
AVSEEPSLLQYGARAQWDYQPGALGITLRGSVNRLQAEDVALSGGGTLDQGDRAFVLGLAALRTTWTESPVLQPYAEVEIGRRLFDREIDSNGEKRSADILALRAGAAYDRGEKWNGSVEVGYRTERLDDPGLENLEGFTFDGTLNWSPRRFTQVSANVQTQANTSSNAGESGSLTYAATLGVTQELRENLSLNAQVGLALQDFTGTQTDETTFQASAGAEWRLNRNAAIFGTIDYEFTDEDTGQSDTISTATGLIGLRVQR